MYEYVTVKEVEDYPNKNIVDEFCCNFLYNINYRICGGLPRNIYFGIDDFKDVDIFVNHKDFLSFNERLDKITSEELDNLKIIKEFNSYFSTFVYKNVSFQVIPEDHFPLGNQKICPIFDFNYNEITLKDKRILVEKNNLDFLESKTLLSNPNGEYVLLSKMFYLEEIIGVENNLVVFNPLFFNAPREATFIVRKRLLNEEVAHKIVQKVENYFKMIFRKGFGNKQLNETKKQFDKMLENPELIPQMNHY